RPGSRDATIAAPNPNAPRKPAMTGADSSAPPCPWAAWPRCRWPRCRWPTWKCPRCRCPPPTSDRSRSSSANPPMTRKTTTALIPVAPPAPGRSSRTPTDRHPRVDPPRTARGARLGGRRPLLAGQRVLDVAVLGALQVLGPLQEERPDEAQPGLLQYPTG